MRRGIVDGRAGCLDVVLGVIDGGRAGRLEVGRRMWLMGGPPGVFDGGPGGALVAVGCSIERTPEILLCLGLAPPK